MEKKLFGNICFTRLVKALMLSYFLTMLMLLGLSFGLYKFDLSEKTVRIGILAVYIISTFAGGFAMGKIGYGGRIQSLFRLSTTRLLAFA